MLVPPTMPRTMVKMLETRSQRASLRGTSITMRALPSGASSMRRTRPMGKPENVMSMPTTTPSESSAVSTSVCVGSKEPRAYRRYRADPTISARVNTISATALSSRCATGRMMSSATGGGTGGGVAGACMGAGGLDSIIVAHQRGHFNQQQHGKHARKAAQFAVLRPALTHVVQAGGHRNQGHGQAR